MSRPIYESDEDRKRQRSVARTMQPHLMPYRLQEMQPLCTWDYMLRTPSKRIYTLLEIKCRDNVVARYPTLTISKHKIDECLVAARYYRAGFVLVVKWIDMLAWVRIRQPQLFSVIRGGRKDRRDAQDIEDMYAIPTTKFKPWSF